MLAALFATSALVRGSAPPERGAVSSEISLRAGRIVSLTPAMTEILFELGAGDRVVAVTRHCDWPPEAAALPKVGSLRPDVEAVLAARPDLVLATTNGLNRDAALMLGEMGLRVSAHRAYTIPELHETIAAVGRQVDCVPAAGRLAARIRGAFDEVRRRAEGLPRRKVLFVVSHDPLFAAAAGSIPDELLRCAGGVNVVGPRRSEYVAYSVEEAIRAAPEVIIEASMTGPGAADFWARWRDIPAVAAGSVRAAPDDFVYMPGPRIDRGLREVAACVHPEAFGRGAGETGGEGERR